MSVIKRAIEAFANEVNTLEDTRLTASHMTWWRTATILALGQGIVLLTLMTRLTDEPTIERSADDEELIRERLREMAADVEEYDV
jgi:hypothetical protein